MRLNLGSGTHYAEGWTNLDARETADTHPDVIVDPTDPFQTFGAQVADQVYLGHVLEHVPWPQVPRLLAQVRAVLKPGGEVLVVGPDVRRTLTMWKADSLPWWLVEAVLEGDHHDVDPPDPGTHKFNCHEARVIGALERAGFVDVAAVPIGETDTAEWPNTVFDEWQFAVRGVAP